jgi:hypothetical protein
LLALGGKLLASALTLASGWKGGFIIPLFFMGVCVAQLTHHLVPSANLWVLVPCLMVAANVGVTKTPIGSTPGGHRDGGAGAAPTTLIAAVRVACCSRRAWGSIETQRRCDLGLTHLVGVEQLLQGLRSGRRWSTTSRRSGTPVAPPLGDPVTDLGGRP